MNGVIVHAKKGERSRYLPITSLLTKSCKPLDIVKAFMDIYPFKTLYIADLNAIQTIENTEQSHVNIINNIRDTFPDLNLWVDSGINTPSKANIWTACHAQLVLGSESFQTIEQYQSLTQQLHDPYTLSLDFSPQGYLGPNTLIQDTKHWPKDIIVMTLAKVGANAGVDLPTMQYIREKTNKNSIYAAGGVRNLNDLLQLKQLGIKGALVASALHHHQISTTDLQSLVT